jgi:hypothetical protein
LQAPAVHFHDSQLRRWHSRRRVFALGQGPGQPGGDGGVALGQPLLADLLGQALDLLGIDGYFGEGA